MQTSETLRTLPNGTILLAETTDPEKPVLFLRTWVGWLRIGMSGNNRFTEADDILRWHPELRVIWTPQYGESHLPRYQQPS